MPRLRTLVHGYIMIQIPFRQIHLDFHTSPFINDVGNNFDPKEFVSTLKEAHVNGINVFAKCHHGMNYYPSKYGKLHPACKRDLLGEMLDELNKEKIIPNVYFPVGWEETAADNESWLEVSPEGVLGGKAPFENDFYRWRKLCLNNREYRDYVKKQVREIMDNYTFAGFWFDIIFQEQCLCKTCLAEIKEKEMDPRAEADRLKHDYDVLLDFQEEMYNFVKGIDESKTIFFNGQWTPDGGYNPDYNIERRGKYQTHVEVESLPSELWGYNLFPLYINYHNRHNSECIGMNGKFHNAWGDFGSLRNEEALEFECFRMIMNGAKCSIGDQLHPRGVLDKATYKRIGQVYHEIERREPWCKDDSKVSEIGIVMAHQAFEEDMLADEGALRMMLELKVQFDFIDWEDDFSKYSMLILPDRVRFDEDNANKISDYIRNGGKVLATHESGLDIQGEKYLFEEANIEFMGQADYTPMYMDLRGYSEQTDDMMYSLYETGSKVKAKDPSQILVDLYKPYFNRTYDCFCSHRQFPDDKKIDEAGIINTGQVIYISHPLFTDYIVNGVRVYREIIEESIKQLVGRKLIESNLPNSAEVTCRWQDGRLVIHMSHYIAEKKSKRLELVDTKLPLYDIELKVNLNKIMKEDGIENNGIIDDSPLTDSNKLNENNSLSKQKILKVYMAPDMEELSYEVEDGFLTVKVPKLYGHGMLVVERSEVKA